MNIKERANYIGQILLDGGVNNNVIVAIVVSAGQESGWDPYIRNSIGAIGLWQWYNSTSSAKVAGWITQNLNEKDLIQKETNLLLSDAGQWSGTVSWSSFLGNKRGLSWQDATSEFVRYWERSGVDPSLYQARYNQIMPLDIKLSNKQTGSTSDNSTDTDKATDKKVIKNPCKAKTPSTGNGGDPSSDNTGEPPGKIGDYDVGKALDLFDKLNNPGFTYSQPGRANVWQYTMGDCSSSVMAALMRGFGKPDGEWPLYATNGIFTFLPTIGFKKVDQRRIDQGVPDGMRAGDIVLWTLYPSGSPIAAADHVMMFDGSDSTRSSIGGGAHWVSTETSNNDYSQRGSYVKYANGSVGTAGYYATFFHYEG